MDNKRIEKRLENYKFVVKDQCFKFNCASLRPFTRYYVIFDQFDFTSFCKQKGKRIGEPLITDEYGKLDFEFFWNRENELSLEASTQLSKFFDSDIGNKIVTITDKAGISFINVTIAFTNKTPDMIFSKYLNASNLV